MKLNKMLVFVGVLIIATAFIAACGAPGPQGPEGPAGPAGPQGEAGPAITAADLTCTECHNDTSIISGKKANWEESLHGSGVAFIEEGGNKSCAGCHSGAAFSEMIAAGGNFSTLESGDADPTHQDCRTCHQIHVTYTGDDWALETNAPVALVTSGATFDGGSGNLCANCHQARRYMANFVAKDAAGAPIPGQYTASARFNTHYSVQVDVLMGLGDFGVTGEPSGHYTKVENTCAGCHMGDGASHSFEPQLATCQGCHEGVEDFNVNGFLTGFEEKYAELEAALLAKGMLSKAADGTISTVPGTYEEGPAQALFFYNLVHEDGSEGIHNPVYFTALMDNALAALK